MTEGQIRNREKTMAIIKGIRERAKLMSEAFAKICQPLEVTASKMPSDELIWIMKFSHKKARKAARQELIKRGVVKKSIIEKIHDLL